MSSALSFRQILGAPSTSATTRDSALIIIDVQNEYAVGKLKVSDVEVSRKAIAALLQRYRDDSGEIIHIVHDTPNGAPVFTPGTELAEEFPEVRPKSGEKVIHKLHPSSFAGTDLQKHLEATGFKKIVLVGYMAHVCISTTSRDGARLGFDVVVAEDCVGDRDIPGVTAAQLTKVALCEIADAFGTVVQSKDIN
ncbi:isochorismatase family [Colletotrichum truncatum]|uniref:Isochorismatase family n=1 Tax=Colletotrichum truncatum TaxID=5467 RepID=A0ACC3ZF68_COLTU|nr:isochorismatase family [Colletotrichum truncatum]KAF6801612.1 isochorismatase family [Colletotrichum truncatum]